MSSVISFAHLRPTTSNPPVRICHRRNYHGKLPASLGRGMALCVSGNFQSPNLKQSCYSLKIPLMRYPWRWRSDMVKGMGGKSLLVRRLDANMRMSSSGSSSGSGQEDHSDSGALETVLKLYSAIKNQNIRELSDMIDDECQCICNFFSSFQPLQGKKQVVDFFTSLIKYLGDHVEFVVQPTLHDGMVVGIHWRLEWNKAAHMPLGKGFSFYTCQIYHGRVVIKNVEMFMEPLLHVEPLRLKTIGYLTSMMDKIKINSKAWKKRLLSAFFALLFIATILLFSKAVLVSRFHYNKSSSNATLLLNLYPCFSNCSLP